MIFRLLLCDIRRLEALGSLGDVKFDEITFGQRLKAFGLNRREMDKNIFAIVLLDKAKPLGVVKPLNSSFCQRTSPPFYIVNCTSDRKKGKNQKFRFLPYRLFRPIVQETKQHILETWAKIPFIILEVNVFSEKKFHFKL